MDEYSFIQLLFSLAVLFSAIIFTFNGCTSSKVSENNIVPRKLSIIVEEENNQNKKEEENNQNKKEEENNQNKKEEENNENKKNENNLQPVQQSLPQNSNKIEIKEETYLKQELRQDDDDDDDDDSDESSTIEESTASEISWVENLNQGLKKTEIKFKFQEWDKDLKIS